MQSLQKENNETFVMFFRNNETVWNKNKLKSVTVQNKQFAFFLTNLFSINEILFVLKFHFLTFFIILMKFDK